MGSPWPPPFHRCGSSGSDRQPHSGHVRTWARGILASKSSALSSVAAVASLGRVPLALPENSLQVNDI